MLIYNNLCDVALLKIKFVKLYIGVKLCDLFYFIFNIFNQIECHKLSGQNFYFSVIIPPQTKFTGGILVSTCPSYRLSVRTSVCLSVCL